MRAAGNRGTGASGGAAGPAGTTASFGVIILAGGAARRMGGADKPGLAVGGRTMLESVVAAGIEAGAQRVVIAGPERRMDAGTGPAPRVADEIAYVREEPPGAGPVPALRCGLAAVTGEWVAVLGADLPFLRADHLRALLRAAGGSRGAVLADDAGRPQWVAGCWRASALREAAARYRGGSLRGLLGPLEPVMLRLRPAPGTPPPWMDCDTVDDLRRARAWSGG
ncbi:MAG: molybdenum cofactor guanylyltransferase [Streptosporangiaceae bacterium]|nr:molybdenum cofactor guanylyltransferase [Streptosporangiaceae bacterium]MBV9854388.1 molybdenum cofactor guanylyltransferase [Streptosporangiaceae bacterium]